MGGVLRLRWVPYLLSQYLWLVVTLIIGVIPLLIEWKQTIPSFSPKNYTTSWNTNIDPLIFLHLSDIHINHHVPEHMSHFNSACRYKEIIDPDLFIITGDLVDDFNGDKFPKYGVQSKEDWDSYNNAIAKYRNENFVEITGNHDEFGVFSFDSPGHNFIKTRNMTEDEFHVSKKIYQINYGANRLHVIKLAPFVWPSAHPPFVFFARPTEHFLDLLEAQFLDINDEDEVFIFSHYPLNLYPDVKSSNGKTIRDIVTKTNKRQYFISGHLHPKAFFPQHQNEILEVVGPDLKGHNHFGVFTLDHGRFVYNDVNNNKQNIFFVTSPIPDGQLTPNSLFFETEGYIRIRAFTSSPPNITVSGAVNGQMESRLSPDKGGYVLSLPYKLEKGSHSVTFSGDYNSTLNFTLGAPSKSFSEKLYENSYIWMWRYILVILFIVTLFITFPLPTPSWYSGFEAWLNCTINESRWKWATIGSIMVLRCRVAKLPLSMRISLFVANLWPLVFPTTFLEIEGKLGMVWTFGYICGGKAIEALWGQVHSLLFLGVVLIPALLVGSSVVASREFHPAFIADIFVAIASLAGIAFVVVRFLSESNGLPAALTSPCFVLMPVIYYAWIGLYRFYLKPNADGSISVPSIPLIG